MSLRSDGSYCCDFKDCNADVVNGSIHYAVFVVTLHPFRAGEPVTYHWGRACGHAVEMLTPESLGAWYTEQGILP